MKLALALLGLLAAAQALPQRAPAKRLNPIRPLIVGGEEALPGERPFQILLQLDGQFLCGGSIYNEEWIVTAAHCAELASSPSRYSVVAGIHNIRVPDATSQTRTVSKNIIHPGYYDLENDIALMKLSQPLVLSRDNNTAGIPLASAGRSFSGNVTISGWGTLESGGNIIPAKLRKVTVPTVSDEECRNAYGEDDIADSMICAGLKEGGKDSCQGDSGGPLTGQIDGVDTLVGIVSWGQGCAFPNYYGVYTEVSYFEAWVRATIAAN